MLEQILHPLNREGEAKQVAQRKVDWNAATCKAHDSLD